MTATHHFDHTAGTALRWTVPWAAALFVVLVLSALQRFDGFRLTIPYATYLIAVWTVGPALVGLILFGMHRASRYFPAASEQADIGPWYGDGFLVALVVFWALGPPSYFFVEYYAFDQGLILCSQNVEAECKKTAPCLEEIKTYGDLASKFWAGGGAVLLAFTALAKTSHPREVSNARAAEATPNDWSD